MLHNVKEERELFGFFIYMHENLCEVCVCSEEGYEFLKIL